jgi:hypothetical protein
MRVEMPSKKKGEKFVFNIKWWYNINNYIFTEQVQAYFEKRWK